MRTPYGRRRFGFFPMLILLALAFITYVVYWLWNNVLVAVVPVKAVTYWQAMGILVLSRILFGGFKFGRPSGGPSFGAGAHWREKWRQMNDEDRAKFRSEWHRRWRGENKP
ncbi:hypothetical protein [Spirosoma sp. KNUC1025]|uniref:hypothetical protein n=1 Tax=Spirosoma sp. KNUC1025 TaxID=2894082 RepID=UPI00386DE29A|nr:hypothetical protein LN737_15490 [Spirosoma sp. KNUC1025]